MLLTDCEVLNVLKKLGKSFFVSIFFLLPSIILGSSILLLSPADNAIDVDIRISFRWQPSEEIKDKELSYSIFVSEDTLIDEKDLMLANIFSNFYTGDVLKPETTYYWKIEATDKEGNTYESDVAKFTTRKLRAGDAYVIFFEEYLKIVPLDDNFVGVKKNEVILMNKSKELIKSLKINAEIKDVLSTGNLLLIITEKGTSIYDNKLNTIVYQINDQVIGIAAQNVLYNNDKIYVFKDFSTAPIEKEIKNIKKAFVIDGFLYVLTQEALLKINSNFEVTNTYSFVESTYDFDYIFSNEEIRIVVLTNKGIILLNDDLTEISETRFQIETKNYERKIFSYYDKLVLLSGNNNLNFYDYDLNLIKTLNYTESFNYFLSANEKEFVLVGDSIKAYSFDDNKLKWSYSTINKFNIITEPLMYKDGLIIGLKDFLTRFLVFYDDFDETYYFNRYANEVLQIKEEILEKVEEEVSEKLKFEETIESTSLTAETEIPKVLEEITQPSTPVLESEDVEELIKDETIEPAPTPSATEAETEIEIQKPSQIEDIISPETPQAITQEPTPIVVPEPPQSIEKPAEVSPKATDISLKELIQSLIVPEKVKEEPTEKKIEETEITKIFDKPYNEYIYGSIFEDDNFYLYGYEGKDEWDAKVWKLDKYGEIVWETTLPGDKTDFFRDAIVITEDATTMAKSIVCVGDTLSYGLNGNVFIASISDEGTVNYQFDYGDIGRDSGIKVLKIDGESYAVAGNLFINKRLTDVFVTKYLNDGTRIWTKNFGGNDSEITVDIKNTQDQGFMVFGATRSFGAGGFDVYALKIDFYGNMKWSNVFGDSNDNVAIGVVQEGRQYYVLYETTSNPLIFGFLEVDELNGFGDSFEYTVEEMEKLLGFTKIEDKYIAYGYRVQDNKKVGIIYEISKKNRIFKEIKKYEFESDFEIRSVVKPENSDYLYVFGNTINGDKQNIVMIKEKIDN